jgi:hypothetical protein
VATEATVKGWLAVLGAFATACADAGPVGHDGIGSQNSSDTVVQTYERTFHFVSPVTCSPFVVQRIAAGSAAEYDARTSVTGETIEATYSIVPADALPVHVDVSHDAAQRILGVAIGPHDLQVTGADNAVALAVRGYDGSTPEITPGTWNTSGTDERVLADAMALLQCMLPVQVELGAIPSFFENRTESRGAGGVVGTANDSPPLLPSWDGAQTILAAYFTAAVCLQPTAGRVDWSCACPATEPNALLGDVAQVCGAP